MKIKCQNCWKEIEKKGQRVLCIKCSNKKDHEMAAKRREQNYFKDYRQKRKESQH